MRQEWLVDNYKIVCNDVLEELRLLSDESQDVVITSPPYNIGLKYTAYADNLESDDYLNWLFQVSTQIHRVLKECGSFFLNIGGTNKQPYLSMDVCNELRSLFVLQNDIVWAKSLSVGQESYGHFKPINSDRFLNYNHEKIFHFTKNGDVKLDRLAIGVPYEHKSNLTRWKGCPQKINADLRCRGNVWFIPYETVQSKKEKGYHPATFPVQLPEMCLKLHGVQSELRVLDPFVGIGSTLMACQRLGIKNALGVDLDPEYCAVALARLGPIQVPVGV